MDDHTRNELLAKLSVVKQREDDARRELTVFVANIDQVRATLGNPYFYSGRSDDDPESKANFTRFQSHEPPFKMWQHWQDLSRDVKTIRQQLRDAGIDAP
jgi:hypothetical protein